MTPHKLASMLLSLPPILYINIRNPISGYSKAPWGLSVLSQVTGIFTGISISPSPLLRQRPDRFAFRAGRNLPDKEFRYLRTVIVTAAVYWGFSSKLALFPLTFQHRAGVSHYTSSYDFAMTCVFAKQSPGPFHCDSPALCIVHTHAREQPFSRSYGFILQSSLTRVISRALVFSTCLPVSVCGTGTCIFLSSFSWQRRIKDFVTIFHSSSCLRIMKCGLSCTSPYSLERLTNWALALPFCVTASSSYTGGTGISTRFPSTTPFGLALGPDLPWADEPSPGILRLPAGRILTCLIVYLYRHSLFCTLHVSFPSRFSGYRTLLYQLTLVNSASSVHCLSPVTFSAQNPWTSELLRTLLMVAASEPTSWLSERFHILFHLTMILGP